MISLRLIEPLISFITLVVAYLVTFTLANYARAWTAKKMGDSTAESLGFLTLNPLVHVDPFGALLLFFTGIGWGKHVPINPYAIYGKAKNIKLIAVYGAEVVAHLITAIISLVLLLHFFGLSVLKLALPMIFVGKIYLPEFTAMYPQSSSFIMACAFIIVAIIYMSLFWAVISFIVNAFDLILIVFYPELYARKERDYTLILAPLLIMFLFAYQIRYYLIYFVINVGTFIAHLMGIK